MVDWTCTKSSINQSINQSARSPGYSANIWLWQFTHTHIHTHLCSKTTDSRVVKRPALTGNEIGASSSNPALHERYLLAVI